MLVRDVMSNEITPAALTTSFADAVRLLQEIGWSELPVTDDEGGFLGIVAIGDILRSLFPDLDELARSGGSLDAAFEAFLQMGRDLADQPIARVVIEDPVVIGPADPLLRVATVMVSRQIHRLFVVEQGMLVGTVGRADICLGALGP